MVSFWEACSCSVQNSFLFDAPRPLILIGFRCSQDMGSLVDWMFSTCCFRLKKPEQNKVFESIVNSFGSSSICLLARHCRIASIDDSCFFQCRRQMNLDLM